MAKKGHGVEENGTPEELMENVTETTESTPVQNKPTEGASAISLLRVVSNPAKGQLISISTDDFTAINPFTKEAEYASIEIDYFPVTEKAIETNSLRNYLQSFRNLLIHQQAVTSRIFEDLKRAIGNNQLSVKTTYTTKGIDSVVVQSELSDN